MNYEVLPIFSKPVFVTKLVVSNEEKDIVNNIVVNENYSSSGIGQNNLVGKQISSGGQDKKILELDNLKFLKEKILSAFNVYKNEIMEFRNIDFILTSSWITKTEMNQSGNFHAHSNSMFSGIYYHKVTENTSDLSFENYNNSNWLVVPEKYNLYNSRQISVTPKNNDIVIFPSEVYHKIGVNNSEDIRYSIAFNLFPISEIGEGDSKIKMSCEV